VPKEDAEAVLENCRALIDQVIAGLSAEKPFVSASSAAELLVHLESEEGHLGRCYLKGRAGDAANVILSAVGYNLRLVLAWLRMILRVVLLALLQAFAIRSSSWVSTPLARRP
jgi:hypothetical protein